MFLLDQNYFSFTQMKKLYTCQFFIFQHDACVETNVENQEKLNYFYLCLILRSCHHSNEPNEGEMQLKVQGVKHDLQHIENIVSRT